jgi:serine phosphatase RsbU (regulator of sigma subunit)/CHASE3 domain sensor protein
MKSVRGQLLLIFFSFIVVSLLTALYTAHHYQKKQDLTYLDAELHELEVVLLQALKEQENFFNFETVNESYFISNESSYLKEYAKKIKQLKKKIDELYTNEYTSENSKDKLALIRSELFDFEISFQSIIEAIKAKGFRDYGVIGGMRRTAHRIENEELLPQRDILMLRRFEKDYIIRQSDIYIDRHSAFLQKCLNNIADNPNLNSAEKELSYQLLTEYESQFKEMSQLDRAIGLKTNTGLKKTLNKTINKIIAKLDELKLEVMSNQDQELQKLNISLTIFWSVFLIISIWLSFKIAGRSTRRISHLSQHINYFVNSNFTARLDTNVKASMDEIGLLWGNFMKMESEIIEYIDLFKEKVDEKTKELSKRNQLIEAQKQELEIKKAESEERYKDLTDGMRYGWRIQNALLPSKLRFHKQVEEGFVFYRPKDIVSGDVYFTHKLSRRDGAENIFSVIDCTGHGVPGAFMSILAMNSLNNAVLTVKHREPHYILQEANNFVYSSMKYYLNKFNREHNTKDGMDMIVCRLKRDSFKLSFAGAHRPLYIVRKTENDQGIGLSENQFNLMEEGDCRLYEVIPVKKTVGTVHPEDSSIFEKLEIDVQEDDMLYLSSDGYADQFGGPSNKKFMTKRLKKFLCSLFTFSVEEQEERLAAGFEDWRGDNDQIDDVCLMGVRV